MEMGRILAFFYGLLAYVVFLAAFLYAIGFIAGLVVPKTIDTGAVTPVINALVIDILLLSLFAVQHSVMARTTFKRRWTQFVPAAIERSTYVLLASLALILLFWQWRPIPAIIWQTTNPVPVMAVGGEI
jgi:protein-S-isoprenylcysteine O-methyltransferase Ste14